MPPIATDLPTQFIDTYSSRIYARELFWRFFVPYLLRQALTLVFVDRPTGDRESREQMVSAAQQALSSETSMLFEQLEADIGVSGRYGLSTPESVWDAIRGFFSQQSSQQAEV